MVGTTGQALATPAEVGDEPVMLARAFAGVVIAGRDRVAAAVLFAIAVAIDLFRAADTSIWGDEGFSIGLVSAPPLVTLDQ